MPVFNEAPVITEVIEEVLASIVEPIPGAELIVVDDGSTDGTSEQIQALASSVREIRLIRSSANSGHGPALITGLRHATREWVFLIDSDGQMSPSDFRGLWARRDETDLNLGMRSQRQDPRHRIVASRLLEFLVRLLSGRRVPDPNVPFKLMRLSLWRDLKDEIPDHALVPSLMIVVGAVRRGWRVAGVEVSHRSRRHGRSTLRAGRLILFGATSVVQLLRYARRLSSCPPRRQETRTEPSTPLL